jgi:ribosome-associated protein
MPWRPFSASSNKEPVPATKQAIKVANLAAEAALDKLAENVVALDVTAPLPLSDIFLLVSGRSERQVAAIADGIEEKLLEAGTKALRREGKSLARWILIDFGDVVVHVMHEEDRMFYALERLWNDCPVVKLEATKASTL